MFDGCANLTDSVEQVSFVVHNFFNFISLTFYSPFCLFSTSLILPLLSLLSNSPRCTFFLFPHFQCLTKGCETSEMTLRRNGLGQLGFHVNYEGIVAEVSNDDMTQNVLLEILSHHLVYWGRTWLCKTSGYVLGCCSFIVFAGRIDQRARIFFPVMIRILSLLHSHILDV